MTTILFAGGGTGGHLMPALAIADAMVRLDPRIRPFFIGSERGVEANVLPQRPWPYELLPLQPIRRRQWWKNVTLPMALYRVVRRVEELVASQRPRLVVGTGGYVAGPVVWTALQAGVPGLLQEQNAFPGIATRRLTPKVRQVHLGFPEARRFLRPGPQTQILDSGNPIQPPPSPKPDPASARSRLGLAPDRPTVLVVGGSQGALAVNLAVDAALAGGLWPAGVQLIWQTGAGTYDRFASREDHGRVLIRPFLDPVAEAYAAADLALCRAGAITIAELTRLGVPTVFIPYPYAAANHQVENAKAIVNANAAEMIMDHEADRKTCEVVLGLIHDDGRLQAMHQNSLMLGKPAAAKEIAQSVIALGHQ